MTKLNKVTKILTLGVLAVALSGCMISLGDHHDDHNFSEQKENSSPTKSLGKDE